MHKYTTLLLVLFVHFVTCRDFYMGMFKKNDILVAQDRLYKDRVPFRSAWAKYGRHFKCPITYVRVVDRLGVGRGPRVAVVRGGLRKRYVVLRLESVHHQPLSVNIYVGCENRMPSTTRTTPPTVVSTAAADSTGAGNNTDDLTTGNDTGNASGDAGDAGAQGDATGGGENASDAPAEEPTTAAPQ